MNKTSKPTIKTVTVTGASAILKRGSIAKIQKLPHDGGKFWLVLESNGQSIAHHCAVWLLEGRDFNQDVELIARVKLAVAMIHSGTKRDEAIKLAATPTTSAQAIDAGIVNHFELAS